ncbi:MAG: phosphoribosylanthranilate isomerase [Lachnospiraceae bacterium]|nr:phosphoribosylanthranilate isomerase [Lachnospiraceae bacterium]
MPEVKICGNKTVDDIQILNRYKPDYAGCILSPGFRRSISEQTAAELRKELMKAIPLVGVFVDDDPERIERLLKEGIIDIAQLHGSEEAAVIRRLKEKTSCEIWKVFRMKGDVDYQKIESCPADLVLLDAGTGSGECFDWKKTAQVTRPFILAGGLQAGNVAEAVAQTRPYAVDVSSAVECDGRKNEERIAEFIRKARGAKK